MVFSHISLFRLLSLSSLNLPTPSQHTFLTSAPQSRGRYSILLSLLATLASQTITQNHSQDKSKPCLTLLRTLLRIPLQTRPLTVKVLSCLSAAAAALRDADAEPVRYALPNSHHFTASLYTQKNCVKFAERKNNKRSFLLTSFSQMQERRLYEADLPDYDDDDSYDDSGSESSAQWATTLYATPEQLRNLPPLPLNNSNYVANDASISHPANPVPDSPALTESDSEDSENDLDNAVFDDSDIDEAASDISEDSLADVVPDPNVLEAIAPADSERNPVVINSARIITRMRARIAENPGTAIQERRNAIETIREVFPLRLLTYGGGLSTAFQPLGVWHEGILLSDIRVSLALELVHNSLVERSTRLRALLDRARQLSAKVSDEEYITAEEFLTDEED